MAAVPLVSIALATYNGARFLEEQLASLFAQSYPALEIIATDDGSSDGTVEILRRYEQEGRIRFVANDRRLGFCRNFERALSLCSGEYIALADQDDVWDRGKIEILVRELGDSSLIYSDAELIDAAGKPLAPSLVAASGIRPLAGHCFRELVCNSSVTGCTALFRRELLDLALPFPEEEPFHDWWLSLVASCRGGLRFLDTPLVRYRQHAANAAGASEDAGFWERAVSHLVSSGTVEKKRDYYELLRRRSGWFLAWPGRFGLDDDEKRFLRDINAYAAAMLAPSLRPQAFLLALRHRRLLYPFASPAKRMLYVMSKLVDKILLPPRSGR
ncbi:glycosyltransferase family 2 protein [Geobacter sp.]|uniref:glycosyltransferase family 2 protein n=1 Tax=Geobacter sp. TaxID=46610 RepID=UPI002613BF5E|nr:glycosyltransferase family 2 protein [Geobacter sp.]